MTVFFAQRRDYLSGFIAFLAVGSGAGLQLVLLLRHDFPLNDGGMLFVMVKDLIANGYSLPAFTTYNLSNIAFAYPPLSLYLTAWLHDWLGIPLLELLRWLPWLFCVLSIPTFGLLSHVILQSWRRAALAMLAYALLLQMFNRTLMGGGLTRAPGLFFAVLALSWIYRMFMEHDRKYIIPAVLFSSLTVLTHSVYALFVIYTSATFFLFSKPIRKDLFHAIIVTLGVLALALPWYYNMVAQHGLEPILAALQTRSTMPLLVSLGQLLFFYRLTHEYFIDLLGVTAMFGLVLAFIEGKFLFGVWLLGIFVFERTSPAHLSFIPLAMLAGLAVERLVFENSLAASRSSRWILLAAFNYLLIVTIISAYLSISIPVLSSQERKAMDWVSENTTASSRFVVLSANDWWEDPVSEWFPALADRKSVNTVQGSEWISRELFTESVQNYDRLRRCRMNAQVSCLTEWKESSGLEFDYLFIALTDNPDRTFLEFVRNLLESPEFVKVYDNPAVAIIKRVK